MVFTKSKVAPGPLGMVLGPDIFGRAAVIQRFSKVPTIKSDDPSVPDTQTGPIESQGVNKPGDVLVKVNKKDVRDRRFDDVMRVIRRYEGGTKMIHFTFCDQKTHQKVRAAQRQEAIEDWERGGGRKRAPTLRVCEVRVNRDMGPKPVVEYRVECGGSGSCAHHHDRRKCKKCKQPAALP